MTTRSVRRTVQGVSILLVTVWTTGCGQSAQDVPAEPEPVTAPAETAPLTAPEDPATDIPDEPAHEPSAALGFTRIATASDGSALLIELPDGAERTARTVSGEGLVSERYALPGGEMFQVNLLGPVNLLPNFGSDAWLRTQLDEWLRLKSPELVDGPRDVMPLSGDHVEGVYVKVRSDNPHPNALQVAVNGCFRVDGHVVMMGGLYAAKFTEPDESNEAEDAAGGVSDSTGEDAAADDDVIAVVETIEDDEEDDETEAMMLDIIRSARWQ